jgi:hypothetical protein
VSSRSTTPLAGNITHGVQEPVLQLEIPPEIRDGDESTMEPSQESQPESPRQVAPALETCENGSHLPDVSRYETISISETANLFRERRYQRDRCGQWRDRLHTAQKSAALTPRLIRAGELAKKTLVEFFKQGDRTSFVLVYNTIHELRDAYKTTWRTPSSHDDSGFASARLEETLLNVTSNFMDSLSFNSRNGVLEFLRLVRTSPVFLADRIGSLSSSQLLALASSHHPLYVNESVLPIPSRGRSQASSLKRGLGLNPGYSDQVLDFGRTDPLSVLLFNVFDLTQGLESPDSFLRLETWASTCARLLNGSGTKYYRFISDLGLAWTANREWSVKPRLELYLMDILEKGAFLLERIDDLFGGFNRQSSTIDPLSTEAAEDFFEDAVQDLFEVLDDPSGGMPIGVLELCNTILNNLEDQETRDRFREFFFLCWFFSNWLFRSLIYPEVSPYCP